MTSDNENWWHLVSHRVVGDDPTPQLAFCSAVCAADWMQALETQ